MREAFPEFAERYHFGKLMSRSSRTTDARGVAASIEEFVQHTGLSMMGYLGPRDRLVSMPSEGVLALLPKKRATYVTLLLQRSPVVSMSIFWYPPADPIVLLDPVSRLDLIIHTELESGWDTAKRLFLGGAATCGAFWGELNDTRQTPHPSFATSRREHVLTVAHLGTANYFGPDYVEFFGGVERFRAAGFLSVEPCPPGVYVQLLEPGSPPEEFKSRQAAVESRLAFAPAVFDDDVRGPVPEFRRARG